MSKKFEIELVSEDEGDFRVIIESPSGEKYDLILPKKENTFHYEEVIGSYGVQPTGLNLVMEGHYI